MEEGEVEWRVRIS